MKKKNDTVRYTAKQIKSKIARGEDRTDWGKANAMTGKKLDASIRADADDVQGDPDWTKAFIGVPAPKDHINIRNRPRRAGVVQSERPGLPDAHEQRTPCVRAIAAAGKPTIKLMASCRLRPALLSFASLALCGPQTD